MYACAPRRVVLENSPAKQGEASASRMREVGYSTGQISNLKIIIAVCLNFTHSPVSLESYSYQFCYTYLGKSTLYRLIVRLKPSDSILYSYSFSKMYRANRSAIKRYLMSRQMTCLSHISPTRTLRKAAEKAPGHHPATRKESFYRAGSPPDPTNSRSTMIRP